MSTNYTAKISGSLVNVIAGTLNVQNQIGQRSTGSISVWTPVGTMWQYGTQVLVYDDTGALVYSGYVHKDQAQKPGGARQGTGYLEHSVQLIDNCYRADKRRVFKTYLNTTAGAIVNDLLGAYLVAEGVTSTSTSIASGITIPEVIWNGSKSVGQALTWLATQSGYWWNIDVNGVLFFQPYTGIPGPTVDGSQIDALKNLSVEAGNDQYINSQYVKGSYAEKGSKSNQLSQTFKGDGNTRSFTLPYEVSHVYQVLLNGVDITAQSLTKGSTGGDFYYAVGDAVLAQDPGQTILTASDTLQVFYTGRYPVLALARNSALVAAQKAREGVGSGLVEAMYTNTKVRTLQAAQSIAWAELAHWGQDATLLEFDTRTKGFSPGQLLTVNLPDFSLSNKAMLVTDVTITDSVDGINIWFHIKAVGSPLENAQFQTFWANLMQQSSDPSDYTDASDTTLSPIFGSTFTASHSFAVTKTQAVCPIVSNTTLCGNTTIVC